MKKIDQYNELEETQKDNRFVVIVLLPASILCVVIASIWTYVQMLGAL